MVETTDLWDSIIDEGVAILRFERRVSGQGEPLLLAQVDGAAPHPTVLTAAHAAMEIDKLIAFDLADGAGDAAQMRRILLEAMSASAPSYDLKQATAGLLDRYRLALAAAVRRAAGPDPATRLDALASPHQD